MPRTPEENERIRNAAKIKIRAAAIDVFIAKGFHSSSIEDVAKKAGISKGLLYNYFKGKSELLAELIQSRVEEISQVMETASRLPAPKEQLLYIAQHALMNVKEQPKAYRFYLHLQTHPEEDTIISSHTQPLKDEMIRQSRVQVEIFRKLGSANPEVDSLHFSTALHGIMLMYSMYPNGTRIEALNRVMIDAFIEQFH
ncbi:TetR/AcrR family transcriptional regulator [Paenibacillus nanensis]|uniref:TetR/AcrR family transcriptional regulator n=1 Tax=Paenibacillus nanensis TaxID=393251 RepID=A0A3A1VGU8_9BACL|nr:TetR/AcrR family transcriptional regulator [Paenibacillus nanensis]RIX59621.1 TetR/AcrR family transcriptional regulator [Paenibacillus nanensis]